MPAVTELAAHWPLLLLVSPLLGACLAWSGGRRSAWRGRQWGIVSATVTLVVAAACWMQFAAGGSGPWFTVVAQGIAATAGEGAASLIPSLAFGIDGLSLMPIGATALVVWVAILSAGRHAPRGLYVELLLGEAIALTVFTAHDFLVFLAGCELWAWWAFVAVGRRGGGDRRKAAQRMRWAMAAAHASWGMAGIGCAAASAWIHGALQGTASGTAWQYGEQVYRLARWIEGSETGLQIWLGFQSWVMGLWLMGVIVRWPLVPFHGWWGAMLTEGRGAVVAVCGSGMMLQNGYVLLRFVVPLLPPGEGGLLAAWGTLAAGYAGFLSLGQRDWRRLGSAASLFAMSTALVGLLSGDVDIALAGWQLVVVGSTALAGVCLLLGQRDGAGPTDPRGWDSGVARRAPRWFVVTAICCGVLGAGPLFGVISGRATVEWWELRRLGIPNLVLLAGGVLTAWSLLRGLLQLGFGPAALPFTSDGDVRAVSGGEPELSRGPDGGEWLIGVLAAAALCLGLFPGIWQSGVRPTFERLHDPFARRESAIRAEQVGEVSGTNIPSAATRAMPAVSTAPLIWLFGGAVLLLASRFAVVVRCGGALAVASLAFGMGVELALRRTDVVSGGLDASWSWAMFWSLGVMGLVSLTSVGLPPGMATPIHGGAWLLRLGALGWAAGAQDVVLCGLAWEVAEVARGAGQTTSSPGWVVRERVRQAISSVCLWIGLGLCVLATGATEFDGIAASLAETVSETATDRSVGRGPMSGLAAVVLLVSAAGLRCGLLPWSFGRRPPEGEFGKSGGLMDQWWSQLVGLTLLVRFTLTLQSGYGEAMVVLLTLAAAFTVVWSCLSTIGEERAMPLLAQLVSMQFGGLVLMVGALGAGVPNSKREAWLAEMLIGGALAVTASVCGLAALLHRLEEGAREELFLDHFRGLMSRHWREAALLTGLLLSLIAAWPFGGFYFRWLGLAGVVMTPERMDGEGGRPQMLLVMGAVLGAMALVYQTNVVGRWFRRLAFDPSVSAWSASDRRWPLAVAAGAVCLSLALGVSAVRAFVLL